MSPVTWLFIAALGEATSHRVTFDVNMVMADTLRRVHFLVPDTCVSPPDFARRPAAVGLVGTRRFCRTGSAVPAAPESGQRHRCDFRAGCTRDR